MTIRGVCLRNQPQLVASDTSNIKAAAFGSVKAMWYQQPTEIRALDVPVLLRLPDSEQVQDGGAKRILGTDEYALQCATIIRQWQAAGVRLLGVQLDCEPNEQASWGQSAYWQYQSFWLEAATKLRNMVAGVRIGFPPLSSNAPLSQWLAACQQAMAAADFVCVDAYWQTRSTQFHPGFGGLPAHYRQNMQKPIILAEWGSSQFSGGGSDGEKLKRWRLEYPVYQAWLESLGYVEAAYIFMQGGTLDWQGFDLPTALYPMLAGDLKRYLVFTPQPAPPETTGNEWFTETTRGWYSRKSNHWISGSILEFYKRNNGFTFLGLPLTETYPCPGLGGLTIQLFERGRAEIQRNGTVTLGLVMADYYSRGEIDLLP